MKVLPTIREKWVQPNVNDISGDIYVSKGIDLTDNQGKVRLGKRLALSFSSSGAPAFTGVPVAFRAFTTSFGNLILGIASNIIIASNADYPGSGFTGYAGTRPVDLSSFNSDMEIYQDDLYITGATGFYKLAFGTTNFSSALYNSLGSGSPHKLCSYGGRLYVTNNNQVYSWDGSAMTTTGNFALTIGTPGKNTIRFIKAGSNKIWIGTITSTNSPGARGYIYEWDGVSTSVTKTHVLESTGAVSCVIKDDVPWVMDTNGRLLVWNGGTFVEKTRLNRRVNKLFKSFGVGVTDGFVHPNGMAVINGRINILIDGAHFDPNSSMEETIPSGIWEYDDSFGLYNKYCFSTTSTSTPISDWGANRIGQAGALIEANYPDSASGRNGTLVAGCAYYSDSVTQLYGVFTDDSNDTMQKAGYLISPKIEPTDNGPYNLPTIEGAWGSLYTMYRKLLNSTDEIVLKFRTQVIESVEANINWLSPTSFSMLASDITIGNYWTTGTISGGEVEIMQGPGSGMCSHVTNVVTAGGGNIIVTVDESHTNINTGSGSARARFQNWKKISGIMPNNQNFNSDTLGFKSSWVQIKWFMRWTGRNELERVLISSANGTPVK